MPTKLPAELQQRIARWCPVNEFLSMMLLDRASYLNLVPSFYKIVVVGSTKQFNLLSETILSDRTLVGRTPLRLKPRGLAITVPNVYRGATPNPSTLAKVLHSLPHLEQLRLDLPRSCLAELFCSGDLSNVPFKLQDLHCELIPEGLGFLRHQNEIQFFNILHLPSIELDQMTMIGTKTNIFLPKLRRVEGNWSNVSELIPGRPICHLLAIHFGGCDSIESIANIMAQASAPLVEFIDVRYFPRVPLEEFVVSWLSLLAYAGESLEKFKLFFNLPIIDTSKRMPTTVKIESQAVLVALKPFKSLRTITIDIGPGSGFVPRPTLEALEFNKFQIWKDACPSLRFVKLLDEVLCEE